MAASLTASRGPLPVGGGALEKYENRVSPAKQDTSPVAQPLDLREMTVQNTAAGNAGSRCPSGRTREATPRRRHCKNVQASGRTSHTVHSCSFLLSHNSAGEAMKIEL